ncbi:hypothetical protein FACS1894211_06330 [Clostridia bacterium]|nr:hypothetical protein FACS1894211_06330 [Clostridia bacterium]
MLKRLKKPFVCLLAGLFLALALSHLGFTGLFAPKGLSSRVEAAAALEPITIANGDFKDGSGSFPKKPNDWEEVKISADSDKTAYKGIVSLHETDIKNNRDSSYHMPADKPDILNNAEAEDLWDTYPRDWTEDGSNWNVLMINTLENRGAFAYDSQSVKVDAYRRVKFSVNVKTFSYKNGNAAGVSLLNADTGKPVGELKASAAVAPKDQNRMLFPDIDTAKGRDLTPAPAQRGSGWKVYTFLIETSHYAVNLKLRLQSGTDGSPANGAAFFKGAEAQSLTAQDYRSALQDADAQNTLVYSYLPGSSLPGKAAYVQDTRVDLTAVSDYDAANPNAFHTLDPYFGEPDTVWGNGSGHGLLPRTGNWETIYGGMGEDADGKTDNVAWGTIPETVAAVYDAKRFQYAVSGITVPFDTARVTPTSAHSQASVANPAPASGAAVNLLHIGHAEDKPGATGVRSRDIAIERFRFYRLSVWYRTTEGGKVTFALTEQDAANANLRAVVGEKQTGLTADEETGLPSMDYWNQAEFYIKGSSVQTDGNAARPVNLELWLGYGGKNDEASHSAGAAYFYGAELELLSPADYKARSEGKTVVDLNTSDSPTVANGNFRDYDYADDEYKFPLSATGWTYFAGDDGAVVPNVQSRTFTYDGDKVARGILPTDNAFYRDLQSDDSAKTYGSLLPGNGDVTTQPANALMIYNKEKTAAGYASSAISVPSSSYAKIGVLVSHPAGPNDSDNGAAIALKRDGKIVAEILNIKTGNAWRHYSFLIAAGDGELSLELLLMNGQGSVEAKTADSLFSTDRPASGAAFFANAENASLTEDDYKNASDTAENRKVDFKSNFGLSGYNKDSALKVSYSFTGKAAIVNGAEQFSRTRAGVLDTSDMDKPGDAGLLPADKGNQTLNLKPAQDSPYVLMIKNAAENGFKFVSDKSYDLNASSWYTVSVGVRTAGIPEDGTRDGVKTKYGAVIGLKGVEGAYFGGVRQDEYTVYTFYIQTGADAKPFNFELGLGDPAKEHTWSTGWAFFDRIDVKPIDKTAYDKAAKDVKTNPTGNADKLILSFPGAADTTEDPKAKSFWDWYWLPSLLFALALVAVLVSAAFRHLIPSIKRRRKPRVTAGGPSYARRPHAESKPERKTVYADDEAYIDIEETKNYVYGDGEPPAEEEIPAGESAAADAAEAETAAAAETVGSESGAEAETAKIETAAAESESADAQAESDDAAERPVAEKADTVEPARGLTDPVKVESVKTAAKSKAAKPKAGDYTDYFED